MICYSSFKKTKVLFVRLT